jgi:uncharacterized protein YcnI
MPRLLRRTALMAVAGVAVLAVTAPPAAAHVTVHSDEAVQGAFAEIAFRVPTESATASTVKLRVAFPPDQVVEKVSVRPQPGWTYQLTTVPIQQVAQHSGHSHSGATQSVSEIEWTAGAGTGIKPGEYEEFRIAAGPLPSTDKLVFRVVQTYSDGEIARWIDLPAADGQEPEHPAPVLTITGTDRVVQPVVDAPTMQVWWALGGAAVALLLAIGSVGISIRRRR